MLGLVHQSNKLSLIKEKLSEGNIFICPSVLIWCVYQYLLTEKYYAYTSAKGKDITPQEKLLNSQSSTPCEFNLKECVAFKNLKVQDHINCDKNYNIFQEQLFFYWQKTFE